MARWVRIFNATVWIEPSRDYIKFMFRGRPRILSRAEIADALGVDLNDTRLHELAYPGAIPLRCACCGGVLPPFERVSICYRQPFLPESSRALTRLTTEARVVHNALRRSLLPRMGGGEAVTSIQQWLLLHIMSHTPFDIVDFLLCEVEESIADGVKVGRQ